MEYPHTGLDYALYKPYRSFSLLEARYLFTCSHNMPLEFKSIILSDTLLIDCKLKISKCL